MYNKLQYRKWYGNYRKTIRFLSLGFFSPIVMTILIVKYKKTIA